MAPLTIARLQEFLKLANIDIPKKSKLADLRELCEKNGLIARPPDEYTNIEKTTIIKCALRHAMNLDNSQFLLLRTEIDKMVNVISRMLRRSSLALCYHMTKLVSSGQPIPDLYKCNNDTYWKNWLKIGIDGVFPDASSQSSYESIHNYIGKILDPNDTNYIKKFPTYFDQVLNYAGRTLKTAVANNTWVPLFNRLARLTKYKLKSLGISNISTFKVVSMIRSEEQNMAEWPQPLQEYVNDIRKRLNADSGDRLYNKHGYDEMKFKDIFKFNYWMQTQFEIYEKRRSKLMPIFSIQRAHIRLDVKSLLVLFSTICPHDEGVVYLTKLDKLESRHPKKFMFEKLSKPSILKKKDCKSDLRVWEDYKLRKQNYDDSVKEIEASAEYKKHKLKYDLFFKAQRDIIASFFNIKTLKKKTPKWTFDGSILTDGVSVSLQFSQMSTILTTKQKTKKAAPKEDLQNVEYDRELSTLVKQSNGRKCLVLGVDPGRTNLVCVSYFIDNKTKKTWSLTRGCYYVQSGIKILNKRKQNRYSKFVALWNTLGGDDCSLTTSNPMDILTYLQKYSEFSSSWWEVALQRKESRDNLQRYAGKRHVMDSFYSKIKKEITKQFPDTDICVAYGSAVDSMNATGPGEIAAPVGPMFASCKRVFKDQVRVTCEFRSTMMSWKNASKKELVYKKIDGSFETLCHSSGRLPPFATHIDDVNNVKAYLEKKTIQGKHRRGGTSKEYDMSQGISIKKKKEGKQIRYPEVRGLRFSPEDGMYLDRDREAALTIARLCCMEKLGLPRPYPFDRRYVIT